MVCIWLLPPRYVVLLLMSYGVASVALASTEPRLFTLSGIETQSFLVLVTILLIGCLVYIGYRYGVEQGRRQQTFTYQKEQQNTVFSRNYQIMELQAIRAQMNPHFIFNCLNAIKCLVMKQEVETASNYLMKFSKLMRIILHNSSSNLVLLSRELEALRLYLDMEALRFEGTFTYTIAIGPEIETDAVKLPATLIQPYVENAIWHGLMHKEGVGHLSINWQMVDERLICSIEDDGIGRHQAAELKSKSAIRSKLHGMQITADRIRLLNELQGTSITSRVVDLVDSMGEACGTRVIITIAV